MTPSRISLGRRAPAFILAAVLAALPTTAQDRPEVWITLGREEAAHFQAALARSGRSDVLAIEAEGEIMVARIREDRIPLLAQITHEDLRRCGGFMAHSSKKAAYEAVAREQALVAAPAPLLPYTIDNGPVVQALMAGQQEANIRSTIESLAAFFTRYHNCPSGQQSATWIKTLWEGYAAGRPDVTVEFFNHTGYTTLQPSVILTIQGTILPSEVVILGAHQDSVAGSNCNTSRAPGADDDASGIANLSEVIRVAMTTGYRPQRTVKFMAYAAEEVGLRGSQQIAAQYSSSGVNVVGVLQLDMTNYKGTPDADIVIYTDFTNAVQNDFVGQLVDTYLALPRTTSACGYGCSDHASWTNRGFPASFPFEAVFGQHNPTIHTVNDTLAQSGNNANHALKFSKLAAAYLAETAKGGFPGSNQAPVANAGPDLFSVTGTTVSLMGSGSDPDGGPGPLAYSWSKLSGPAVTINNANQAVASVTPITPGTYVFRLAVNDTSLVGVDDTTLTVTPGGGPQNAAYNFSLAAPKCEMVGSSCDSGLLLNGRANLGPEASQPNTLRGACGDGNSGRYHADESNDRLKVLTLDGGNFAPGKVVRIEAQVWAWSSFSLDKLDLYYTANADSPVWTFLTTLTPSAPGLQLLTAQYALPVGGVQAVRARFRFKGSAAPCGAGVYDDHDDLAFAVDSGAPPPPDGVAVFEAALQAPRCSGAARSCDSGAVLLRGRGNVGPETHQPNTLAVACADGASGAFHVDESNDRLKVFTADGTALAPGKTARVEATVWAYRTPASDKLDLYYAADATNPSWTLIGTLTPTVPGAQTLSATYTLPAGPLQAVRARFRYQGSAGACGTGAYDDHDDLVFAVP